jgi:hypothetical protein
LKNFHPLDFGRYFWDYFCNPLNSLHQRGLIIRHGIGLP